MIHVLIIEPDNDILALVHSLLAYAGYDVRGVRKASEAAALVEYWRPQVILTDVLPQPRAEHETILALRSAAGARDVPIVMMTSRSNLNTQRAQALGYAGFVAKPFSIHVLLREIAATTKPSGGAAAAFSHVSTA